MIGALRVKFVNSMILTGLALLLQFGRLALESVMKSVCGYDSPFVQPPQYEKGDFFSGEYQAPRL